MSKVIRKTFKYRLYPNKEQVEKLQWHLARCCQVYNACLQERRDAWTNITKHPNFYADDGKSQIIQDLKKAHAISLYDQQNQLAPMKEMLKDDPKLSFEELSAAHILNDVCHRVDLAFKAFFDRVKAWNKGNRPRKPGYPRWRSVKRYDSFCYPDTSGWKLEGKTLILTKIGTLKVKLHRPIEGTIKTCTVCREEEHWYVTFSCEVESKPLPVSYEDVGIDLGVSKLATLSDGEIIEHPRCLRKSEKKLQASQQVLSRKKRGTKRRKKALKNVTRIHRKVARQRKDYLHKASRTLVNQYQVMVFEDLQIANMVKRPKPKQDEETGHYLPNKASAKAGLNKSILDAGWGMFKRYCDYKAEWAGRSIQVVIPQYTSQTCSACGYRDEANRESQSSFICKSCGFCLNADHNAALNILTLGMQSARGGNADTPEHSLSHKDTIEVGVASAFVSASSLLRKKRKRAAESLVPLTLSQYTLWDNS